MALTNRGSGWEWLNSWWILLTLVPFGFTSFIAFFYAWIRARKTTWLIAAIVYFMGVWGVGIYLLQREAAGQQSETIDLVMGLTIFAAWGISFIHALIARKDFLLRLDARTIAGQRETDQARTRIRAEHDVSDNRIDEALVKFNKDDLTVKMCSAIFSVMPFAPDFRFYFNLKGAVERLSPGNVDPIFQKARLIAREDDIVSALKVSSALDTADSGIGIFTGAKNIYDHVKDKPGRRTFEADPQQAADAGIKILGLSYMIAQLFEGSITEKVQQFFSLPAGKEIALFYASAEIALPFTDNLLESGGNWISSLMDKGGDQNKSKFIEYVGNGPFMEAKPILESMEGQMDAFLGQVRMYVDPLMEKAKGFAPTALNAADSISGGLATAVDFMPAWKFLGARLAAEACVNRVIKSQSGLA